MGGAFSKTEEETNSINFQEEPSLDLDQSNQQSIIIKMRDATYQQDGITKDETVLDISNLGLFINKQRILKQCLTNFEEIKKQQVSQGEKAKDFKAGGCSIRVELNFDSGVFYIQKECNDLENVKKEKEIIKLLSEYGITLPLIQRDYQKDQPYSENNLVEQVAGIQNLKDIYNNIKSLYQERAFLPFIKCLVIQLFDKLRMIHELGYAHSDIKPQNIVMGFDRNFYFIDFGGMVRLEKYYQYFSEYTASFNTSYFQELILTKKKYGMKDIILCDNAQLSLSILFLLGSNFYQKSFQKMNEKDFIKLFYDVYSQFRGYYYDDNINKNQQELFNNEMKDLLSILIFLFSFIMHPLSVNDILKEIELYGEESNQQILKDEMFRFIGEIQVLQNECKLESTLQMEELIQFYSKIEDIEFVPNKNQLIIKAITPSNIRFIQLLAKTKYNIKCTGFLDIHYDVILQYKEFIKIATEKLTALKLVNGQSQKKCQYKNQIFSFEQENDNTYILNGLFIIQNNDTLYTKKVIKINKRLEFEEKLLDIQQFYEVLQEYFTQQVNSFNEYLSDIKEQFLYEKKSDFKSQYNQWILEQPEQIKITDSSSLKDNLKHFESLLKFNQNLKEVSLNLKEFKDYKELSRILRNFGQSDEENKILQLHNITKYDEDFSKEILQGMAKWESLTISHQDNIQTLPDKSYQDLYLPENGFQCSNLKITFQQTNNEVFTEVCKNILWACRKVDRVELDFQNISIQQEDHNFTKLFSSLIKAQQQFTKELTIHLQNDEKQGDLNPDLLKYLQKGKHLCYFKLIVNNVKVREAKVKVENQLKKLVDGLKNRTQQLKFDVLWGELKEIELSNYQILKKHKEEITVKYHPVFSIVERSTNTLLHISLESITINSLLLVELFVNIFNCPNLINLSISLQSLVPHSEQLNLEGEKRIENQRVSSTKLSKLKFLNLDFSHSYIDISFLHDIIGTLLEIPPSQFSKFSILFLDNMRSSIKLPKEIVKLDDSTFSGLYQIFPDFQTIKIEQSTNIMQFASFTSMSQYKKIIDIDLTDTNWKSDSIDILKEQIKYLFGGLFSTTNISKLILTIGLANYSVSYQIRQFLDQTYQENKKIMSIKEISLEIKTQDQQQVKELISLNIFKQSKTELKIYHFNPEYLYILSKNLDLSKKTKNCLKIIDYLNEENKQSDFKFFEQNSQSLSNIILIYTNKELYKQAKQCFKNIPQLNIKFQENVTKEALPFSNSNGNKTANLNQTMFSPNIQISQAASIHNQSLPVELQQSVFKMVSKNFQVFIPYYSVNYEERKEYDLDKLIIGQDIGNFTLRLTKSDYLDILQVQQDSQVLQTIEIDFFNQKLDLDLVQKIFAVLQEKRHQLRQIHLNFMNSNSSYAHDEAKEKLRQIATTLSTCKQIHSLILNINGDQFDSVQLINSFLYPQLRDFQVFVSNFSVIQILELLHRLENHQQLIYYCVKQHDMNGKEVKISCQDKIQSEYHSENNTLQIMNNYCLGVDTSILKNINTRQTSQYLTLLFENTEYISDRFLKNILSHLSSSFNFKVVAICIPEYNLKFIEDLFRLLGEFSEFQFLIHLESQTFSCLQKQFNDKHNYDNNQKNNNNQSTKSNVKYSLPSHIKVKQYKM